MSFLFGRRPRTNTVDLPKQAKEQISKLDGPGGTVKVRILSFGEGRGTDLEIGRRACKDIGPNEICPARNSRCVLFICWVLILAVLIMFF